MVSKFTSDYAFADGVSMAIILQYNYGTNVMANGATDAERSHIS